MEAKLNNPVQLGRRLADYLRELRRRKDATQYEICQATGISHTTYRRYERNEGDSNAGISLDALCALAEYDGCSVGELINRIDDTPRTHPPPRKPELDLNTLFRDLPPAELEEFSKALSTFESDRAIPNAPVWLVRIGTVLLHCERRFQLRTERDILDQGINSDGFNDDQSEAMIRRLEQIIREQFKRK